MPHTANGFEKIDTGLTSLILIARFHSVSADPEHLKHQFGSGQSHFSTLSLIHAARYLELKAKEVDCTWDKLQKTSLPVIAQHKDGRYFIIARVDDAKVLIHDPLEKKPLTLPRKILEDAWNGKLILVMKQGFQASAIGKFDISWFIPAIKKHKKIFSEVLLASFFIQLFALVTPLFFQVIIDKVLVHKGLTTLTVLAIGLLAVSFFDVLLNGLRTYVLSHTVNKIDVSLGAKLFNHLLKLPIGYFQSRAVGNTVARVKTL